MNSHTNRATGRDIDWDALRCAAVQAAALSYCPYSRLQVGAAGLCDDGRMVTGEPKAVAERLLEMKDTAQADEIVVVTPSLDRERRTGSFVALADAWRRAA